MARRVVGALMGAGVARGSKEHGVRRSTGYIATGETSVADRHCDRRLQRRCPRVLAGAQVAGLAADASEAWQVGLCGGPSGSLQRRRRQRQP